MKKNKYNFLDPSVIMSVVVVLIILAVGTYIFFTVVGNTTNSSSLESNTDFPANINVTQTWGSIGNQNTANSLRAVLSNGTTVVVPPAYYTINTTTYEIGVTNTGWY